MVRNLIEDAGLITVAAGVGMINHAAGVIAAGLLAVLAANLQESWRRRSTTLAAEGEQPDDLQPESQLDR